MNPDQIVQLENVTKTYRTQRGEFVHAVAETSLVISPCQFVCVVGPSGCGKTTLLKILAGFESPTTGSVTVGDKEVTGPGPDRGVVFQHPNLYPWLSLQKNIEFGLRMRRVPKKMREETARHFIDMVGLSKATEYKPYELSGGMQQRAQIARVLANDPKIILMDEPFGALDALTRRRLQDQLRQIWQERRTTVFFITHSVEEAVFLGERILVMSSSPGRVIMDTPVNVRSDTNTHSTVDPRSSSEFIQLRNHIMETIFDTDT